LSPIRLIRMISENIDEIAVRVPFSLFPVVRRICCEMIIVNIIVVIPSRVLLIQK
jgi:hypothetical protein